MKVNKDKVYIEGEVNFKLEFSLDDPRLVSYLDSKLLLEDVQKRGFLLLEIDEQHRPQIPATAVEVYLRKGNNQMHPDFQCNRYVYECYQTKKAQTGSSFHFTSSDDENPELPNPVNYNVLDSFHQKKLPLVYDLYVKTDLKYLTENLSDRTKTTNLKSLTEIQLDPELNSVGDCACVSANSSSDRSHTKPKPIKGNEVSVIKRRSEASGNVNIQKRARLERKAKAVTQFSSALAEDEDDGAESGADETCCFFHLFQTDYRFFVDSGLEEKDPLQILECFFDQLHSGKLIEPHYLIAQRDIGFLPRTPHMKQFSANAFSRRYKALAQITTKQERLGITTFYWYIASHLSASSIHIENNALNSINFNLHGGVKIWIVVPETEMKKLDDRFKTYMFGYGLVESGEFFCLRHKRHILDPTLLDALDIDYRIVLQREGQAIVTSAGSYHEVFNPARSIANAINFAGIDWFHRAFRDMKMENGKPTFHESLFPCINDDCMKVLEPEGSKDNTAMKTKVSLSDSTKLEQVDAQNICKTLTDLVNPKCNTSRIKNLRKDVFGIEEIPDNNFDPLMHLQSRFRDFCRKFGDGDRSADSFPNEESHCSYDVLQTAHPGSRETRSDDDQIDTNEVSDEIGDLADDSDCDDWRNATTAPRNGFLRRTGYGGWETALFQTIKEVRKDFQDYDDATKALHEEIMIEQTVTPHEGLDGMQSDNKYHCKTCVSGEGAKKKQGYKAPPIPGTGKFNDHRALLAHLDKTKRSEIPHFRCLAENCNNLVETRSSSIDHIKEKHLLWTVYCPSCSKMFPNYYKFKAHFKEPTKGRRKCTESFE